MNASSVLGFEFSPAQDPVRRNDGWGQGTLKIGGRPYWFFNSESEPKPVEWTWVDFLEHIAEVWGALVSEQAYPFGWLNVATHPGELWKVAEGRWARLRDVTADQEEPQLLAFDRRHNLSAAWKGIGLPALTWLRVGETLWLCPEGGEPIRASFADCRDTLVSFGNKLAEVYSSSSNPRVAAAVLSWRERGDVFRSNFLGIVTGLSRDQLQAIQGGQDDSSYWELAANTDWESGQVDEGELLAAARMTAGVIDVASISRVVKNIRGLRKRRCDALDALSAKATAYLASKRSESAFEAGYQAADFLKSNSPEAGRKYVDIGDLFLKLNVELVDINLGTDKVDAVAVWGARGPCVLLNTVRAYAHDDKRTRMTLAHELCHLLVDRRGGLPFCEVLGGNVDHYVERRAKAFSAELLLPRASVEGDWIREHRNFSNFQLMLTQTYGVSKTVACTQVYNSNVFAKLDRPAQDYVESRLHKFEGQQSQDSVRVAGVV